MIYPILRNLSTHEAYLTYTHRCADLQDTNYSGYELIAMLEKKFQKKVARGDNIELQLCVPVPRPSLIESVKRKLNSDVKLTDLYSDDAITNIILHDLKLWDGDDVLHLDCPKSTLGTVFIKPFGHIPVDYHHLLDADKYDKCISLEPVVSGKLGTDTMFVRGTAKKINPSSSLANEDNREFEFTLATPYPDYLMDKAEIYGGCEDLPEEVTPFHIDDFVNAVKSINYIPDICVFYSYLSLDADGKKEFLDI